MLTADLLRVNFTQEGVEPRYVDTAARRYRTLASDLLGILSDRVGGTLKDIDDALDAYAGDRVQYKVQRGLVKTLKDGYCEFAPYQPIPSEEVRRTVFTLARKQHPIVSEPGGLYPGDRSAVLKATASQYNVTPEEIEMLLYADLPENHRLHSFSSPSVDELLMRYNVALAQALLMRADTLQLTVERNEQARLGVLFRYIKLCGLIHVIEKADTSHYRLSLDGPVGLFRLSRKYGLRMAMFLPGLLQCANWQLSADVRMRDGRRAPFRLHSNSGLTSHHAHRGLYDSKVEEAFAAQFDKLRTDWRLEREADVVDLGEEVMIPDFVLRHPDGRSALLEIVGYWRPDYLQRKMKQLQVVGRRDMIVAVSRHLGVEEGAFDGAIGGVIWFSARLRPQAVIDAAEALTST